MTNHFHEDIFLLVGDPFRNSKVDLNFPPFLIQTRSKSAFRSGREFIWEIQRLKNNSNLSEKVFTTPRPRKRGVLKDLDSTLVCLIDEQGLISTQGGKFFKKNKPTGPNKRTWLKKF